MQLKLLFVKVPLVELTNELILLLCTLAMNCPQEDFLQMPVDAEVRLVKMIFNCTDGKVKTIKVQLVVVGFRVCWEMSWNSTFIKSTSYFPFLWQLRVIDIHFLVISEDKIP